MSLLGNDDGLMNLEIRIWDVDHGIAIWIKTPNDQNHWIDGGKKTINGHDEFNPAYYVRDYYGVTSLDYLVISHPDTDHYNGLHDIKESFNPIRVLSRNKEYFNNSMDELFPDPRNLNECNKSLYELHKTYTSSVNPGDSPLNPQNNGGVDVKVFNAPYYETMTINDSSLVVFYKYKDRVFIAPGDIQEPGWNKLYEKHNKDISAFIKGSRSKILVAPHHGSESGYTKQMLDIIKPTFVIISEKYGYSSPTDDRFRNVGTGEIVDGKLCAFASTKTSGRVKVSVDGSGKINISTINKKL